MKRVAMTSSRYLLRSRGGHGGNREHSAPATATPPAFKVRHPSQLLPGQRHIHLVEVKYCEDTVSGDQAQECLGPPSRSTATFCRDLSRASAQDHTSACDRCDQGGLQDERHAKQTNETSRLISDLMDIFCAVGTVEQTEQPNYLAEGQTPL
eukprot:1157702-Pelagomonas_calceolata.AAC.8